MRLTALSGLPEKLLPDDKLCPTLVRLRDDPVGVHRRVGDQAAELDALDRRRHTDRVGVLARQQDEPHQIAQHVGERQDLGRQAASGAKPFLDASATRKQKELTTDS